MTDGLPAERMKKDVGWHPTEIKKNFGLTTEVGIKCRWNKQRNKSRTAVDSTEERTPTCRI